MKKALFITATILLTGIFSSFSQTQECEEKPYIEVNGSAKMEVIPDEIFIKIRLKDRMEGKKKISIATQEQQLKEIVQKLNVPMENLSLTDANSDFIRIRRSKNEILTQKTFVLKLSKAETVSRFFQELEEVEILDADITHVSHSKMEEFRQEVKIKAIKAAKKKAKYLLEAIDEEVGKAVVVRENNVFTESILQFNEAKTTNGVFLLSEKKRQKPVQFKKMKLKAEIYVEFLIK